MATQDAGASRSLKIVCYHGKLYGKPFIVTPNDGLQPLTNDEMAKFPWGRVTRVHHFAPHAPRVEDISFSIPQTYLSDNNPCATSIYLDRLHYHDTNVIQFAKGSLLRTQSLVSKLPKAIVHKIIALALAENFCWENRWG